MSFWMVNNNCYTGGTGKEKTKLFNCFAITTLPLHLKKSQGWGSRKPQEKVKKEFLQPISLLKRAAASKRKQGIEFGKP